MDYRNAPGRNWTRSRRRKPLVQLRSAADQERRPSSVWYSLRDLTDAPGRNWTHAPKRRRPGRLNRPERPDVPERERGGGDHDEPYTYRAPSWRWTFPFTERQYARLLILRGKRRDQAELGELPTRPAAVTASA
jgi:hypothetical protein